MQIENKYINLEKSQPGNTIEFDSRKLINNTWGAPPEEVFASSIFQNESGSIGWSWNRPNPMLKPGQTYPQPLYPCIRIGGSPLEASKSRNFPLKWGEVQSLFLDVIYNYLQNPTGSFDLAYDIFFINLSRPGPEAQRKAEIMIWIDGTQKQPPSSFRGDYSDGSNSYTLYSRVLSDGRLYAAFILKGSAQKQHSVNAKKLMDYLNLDPEWFIPGVEFGNEVWNSSGRIEINKIAILENGNQI